MIRDILRALVFLFLVLGLPRGAEAADPVPEKGALDKANDAFAAWVVGPVAMIMFQDIVFWDDRLPPEQAVGQVVDGQMLMAVREGGFDARSVFEAEEAIRFIDPPEPTKLGRLDAQVQTSATQLPDGGKMWSQLATLSPQAVDLVALGLEPVEADAPPSPDDVVAVSGLADFRVQVDRRTGMTLPMTVQIPAARFPVRVGDTVITPEGRVAEVLALGAPLRLLDLETHPLMVSVPNPDQLNIPIVVAWLVFGAVFFTLRMSFVNLRAFPHAVVVTMGKYDHPDDDGEISHFQALSSALSATVGLGNIAGVAIAVSAGGPGAVFWMIVAGFLGMSSKFTECTLGQMYRITKPDGTVSGGPMHYLDKGLAELGLGPLGKVLAFTFAVMCVGGSLGGGNMFQANQSFAAVFDVLLTYGLATSDQQTAASVVYGLVLAFVVGLVIIGGIRRIGAAAGLIVPVMCGVYLLAGAAVLVVNADKVPAAFTSIFVEAFTPQAGIGGMMGVLVQGFRRAAFSNEAGVGSASIAHSAATTAFPVREGIVALLEPFIDTIVVCTMTGVVVVVTGAYQTEGANGVLMTASAFGSVFSWFPVVLSFAVLLFAFSTMISWSYYGERCITWLVGDVARMPYRVVFLACVFFGSVFNLGPVLDFSDLMILGMAFPNILGALLLSGKVKAALDDYLGKLGRGELDVVR